ncbi:squalene/phytoene synthase family protein [Alexandriicola marinus]|uniref:squalene/phytoene synthase family protein n=1 Tax=Alexandriicola marinus TaxID=2081710 RepID=UPI001F0C1500|nr:squalene/phytoene synthase family protein [Alexandriicola marinus]
MSLPDLPAEEINACAELVRRGDPDRFLIAMAAPPAQRGPILVLLAMNLEVARAPYLTAEPIIAEMRLQWWRDAVTEAVAGKPARAHEVAAPLSRLITQAGLPDALFHKLIDARRWDIEAAPFEDEAEFLDHMEATGGALMTLATRAVGGACEAAAGAAGVAMGIANWMIAIPELEARGKRPLPDGRPEAVGRLAGLGLERLAAARSARPDPALAPVFRLSTFAGPVLTRAKRDPGSVSAGAVGLSEFGKRARLLRLSLLGGW